MDSTSLGDSESAKSPKPAETPEVKTPVSPPNEEPKAVELTRDVFGTYYDKNRKPHPVERFTWRNQNRIQVQVITYGARITSVKLPNRYGKLGDILMGFDNLKGYLQDNKFSFGAVLGRCANVIENSTFVIDNKQYWVTKNKPPHHARGGTNGFDKKIWIPHVEGTKLVLSHVSNDGEEGYPGDVLVRVTYELSARNSFRMSIEAFSTKVTIVDITNALYFNLAGHAAGPEELHRHRLTVNADCFTVLREEDGLPTGMIQNVARTQFDFQMPKLLGKIINQPGVEGIDQNLCVNRGVQQDNCFVARLLYAPMGRMLEIYSNQCGVNVSTANDLGPLVQLPLTQSPTQEVFKPNEEDKDVFELVGNLHDKIKDAFESDEPSNYAGIRALIAKVHVHAKADLKPYPEILTLTPVEMKYLEEMRDAALTFDGLPRCADLAKTIHAIISSSVIKQANKEGSSDEVPEEQPKLERETEESSSKKMADTNAKSKSIYNAGRIVGKNGAIYKKHGSVCIQTQNYPNAIYHSNFPNCILRPGQTYRHTIVYNFWIRSGNPANYMKRTDRELEDK